MIFKRADFEVVRSEFDTPHLPQKKFQPPARKPSLRPVVLTYPMPYLVDESWSLRATKRCGSPARPTLRRPDASEKESPAESANPAPTTMHSPTLANDFASRSTLAAASFQPLLFTALDASSANPVFSDSCGLFFSLCTLFDAPLVCFQQLADSLCKTPGVWGISATSPRPLHLCVLICPFLSSLYFHSLTNPSSSRIDLQHSLFSCTCKSIFPQLLCIQMYTKPLGVGSKLWLTTDSVTPA